MGDSAPMPRASRLHALVTNLRCNQACTYCDRRAPQDDLRAIGGPALRARVQAALAAGADGIAFTGGEPTMRRDLEALAAAARTGGAREILVETNATLVDPARARSLRDAGVGRARVNLPVFDDALDAITRDPGGFRRARAGIEALAAAGVTVDLTAAVVVSALPHLAALPAAIHTSFGEAVRCLELAVPVQAPDARELVTYPQAAAVAAEVAAEAARTGLPVVFQRGLGVPPCTVPPGSRGRLASLFSLSPASRHLPGHSPIAECGSCAVADRCGGLADVYRARHGLPAAGAVQGERWRRRLSLPRPASDQLERELTSRAFRPGDGPTPDVQAVVRVLFRCNQACRFCFVSTQLPDPRPAAVERAIAEAGRRGDWIALSGGEPTLHPRLASYLRLAAAESRHPVSLQTNAVLLDDRGRVAELARAGLGDAFVSLHGATAAVAEAVTQAPGTHARTLAGLDNLAAERVPLTVNFVLCGANAHEAPAAVALAAARWPGAVFNLSFVAASTDAVPRDRALIPRFSDVLHHLREMIATARERGVRLIGIESMCGLPLCIVPEALTPGALFEIPAEAERGDFVKTEACRSCADAGRCWGLRRTYADLHGTAELRPVPPASADATSTTVTHDRLAIAPGSS